MRAVSTSFSATDLLWKYYQATSVGLHIYWCPIINAAQRDLDALIRPEKGRPQFDGLVKPKRRPLPFVSGRRGRALLTSSVDLTHPICKASSGNNISTFSQSSLRISAGKSNTMSGKFEPKAAVELAPPKDDPIQLDHLALCDGKPASHAIRSWLIR